MENKAYYIILENEVLLSKKKYSDWREIQDEYYEIYKTNLSPLTCDELIEFFEDDYKDECLWPFSKESIIKFYASNDVVLRSK